MRQGKFAAGTNISVEKTVWDIQTTLNRYGATRFMSGYDTAAKYAVIGFEINNRQVKFVLNLPSVEDFVVKTGKGSGTGMKPNPEKAYEQETKRLWRALHLAIKAKLEVVASGISTFEQEFMANIVMPNGQVLGETVIPLIEQAYSTGKMPSLLTGGS